MAKIAKRISPNDAEISSLISRARTIERYAEFVEDENYMREIKRAERLYAKAERLKAKKRVVKRKMKVAGQEAGVFIAKARKAKVVKEQLTAAAKEANNKSNSLKRVVKNRKLSKSALNRGGGYIYYDGTKNPPVVRMSRVAKGKYTSKQLAEIPKLEKAAESARVASKGYARKSGGTATGIKRTAEAAIGRIATGKAIKANARKAGILGMVGMFINELNGKKNGRG